MTFDLLPEVTPVEFMAFPSFLVLLNRRFISVLWTIIKGFVATGFTLSNIKHKEKIRGSVDMLMNSKTRGWKDSKHGRGGGAIQQPSNTLRNQPGWSCYQGGLMEGRK